MKIEHNFYIELHLDRKTAKELLKIVPKTGSFLKEVRNSLKNGLSPIYVSEKKCSDCNTIMKVSSKKKLTQESVDKDAMMCSSCLEDWK